MQTFITIMRYAACLIRARIFSIFSQHAPRALCQCTRTVLHASGACNQIFMGHGKKYASFMYAHTKHRPTYQNTLSIVDNEIERRFGVRYQYAHAGVFFSFSPYFLHTPPTVAPTMRRRLGGTKAYDEFTRLHISCLAMSTTACAGVYVLCCRYDSPYIIRIL